MNPDELGRLIPARNKNKADRKNYGLSRTHSGNGKRRAGRGHIPTQLSVKSENTTVMVVESVTGKTRWRR